MAKIRITKIREVIAAIFVFILVLVLVGFGLVAMGKNVPFFSGLADSWGLFQK